MVAVLGDRPSPVEPADDAGIETDTAVLQIGLQAEVGEVEPAVHVVHLQHQRQAHRGEGIVAKAGAIDVEAADVAEQLVIAAVVELFGFVGEGPQHRLGVRHQTIEQVDPLGDAHLLGLQQILQRLIPAQPHVAVGGKTGDAQIEVVGAVGVDAHLQVVLRPLQGLLIFSGLRLAEPFPPQGGPVAGAQPGRIGGEGPGSGGEPQRIPVLHRHHVDVGQAQHPQNDRQHQRDGGQDVPALLLARGHGSPG